MPKCAGECRFVRVIRVLDASWTRTCVALVLAAAARPAVAPAPRTRRCHTDTRACSRPEDRLPSAPAGPPGHPITPAARPGMTHRDEQSMRRRTESTHNDALMFVKGSRESIPISAVTVGVAGYFFVRGGAAGLRTRQGWAAPDGRQALMRSRPAGLAVPGDGRQIDSRPARTRQPNSGPGRPRSFGR